MATDWTRQQIIDETIRQASLAGTTDPAVVLAVFEQESNFDERAIGDGGDSVGLRQLNKNGQLYGRSFAWAMDPANAIPEAIRAFAGIKSAHGATNKQNPANKAEYERTLAGRIAKWTNYLKAREQRTGGGVPGGRIVEVIGPLDGPSAGHMDHVHVGGEGTESDPTIAYVVKRAKAHGLRQTSAERSPAENARVGGSATSLHLSTNKTHWARDFAGAAANMRAFNEEMRGLLGGASGSSSSSSSSSSSDSDLQRVGLLDKVGFPSKEDLIEVAATTLLLGLGLGLVAVGVIATFKGQPVGEAGRSVKSVALLAATRGAKKG